jgi:hypothetical protein
MMTEQTLEERSWPVFDPGEQVELFHMVESGDPPAPTSPATAAVLVQRPDGTEYQADLNSDVTEPTPGDLRCLFTAELEGWYWYRWDTTAPKTVEQGLFEVRDLRPQLAP